MAGFLDIFNVTDSDGVHATEYKLNYAGSVLSRMDSHIFGMITELIYVVFQMMVIPANALLGAVFNSSAWLGMLGDLYQKLAAPLYSVFPPWSIACFGLAIVAVSVLRSKPDAKPGRGQIIASSSNSMDRLGGALAMSALVLVLTYNPFALMAKLLELVNGFSLGLASAVTGGGNDTTLTTGQALVDVSIRTPTIALNYGQELNAGCRTLWSQAMAVNKALEQSSGCFAVGADNASPLTIGTALLMLILPALPMLAFCGVAAWTYFKHLSMSVFFLLATGWAAAFSVHRRDGFRLVTTAVARSVSHLVMAVVTSMLAVALPATVAGLGTKLVGLVAPDAQAFVMMASLGIGFAVAAVAIRKVTDTHGALAKALQLDAVTNVKNLMGIEATTPGIKSTEFKKLSTNKELSNTTAPKLWENKNAGGPSAKKTTRPDADGSEAGSNVEALLPNSQPVVNGAGQGPAQPGQRGGKSAMLVVSTGASMSAPSAVVVPGAGAIRVADGVVSVNGSNGGVVNGDGGSVSVNGGGAGGAVNGYPPRDMGTVNGTGGSASEDQGRPSGPVPVGSPRADQTSSNTTTTLLTDPPLPGSSAGQPAKRDPAIPHGGTLGNYAYNRVDVDPDPTVELRSADGLASVDQGFFQSVPADDLEDRFQEIPDTDGHPAAWLKPLVDMLSRSNLISQLEMIQFTAGNRKVRVEIHPDDDRIKLHANSDVGNPLSDSADSGFGDLQ